MLEADKGRFPVRQRDWNCFWSNYKAYLEKKQERQVFSRRP